MQVSALQSANAALSEALVAAREELEGKPGGAMEAQLAAVRVLLLLLLRCFVIVCDLVVQLPCTACCRASSCSCAFPIAHGDPAGCGECSTVVLSAVACCTAHAALCMWLCISHSVVVPPPLLHMEVQGTTPVPPKSSYSTAQFATVSIVPNIHLYPWLNQYSLL